MAKSSMESNSRQKMGRGTRLFGSGSNIRVQNGTLVNGKVDKDLWSLALKFWSPFVVDPQVWGPIYPQELDVRIQI